MNGQTTKAIVRRYREGFRLDKIAERYKISVDEVLDVLVEKGAVQSRLRNALKAQRGGPVKRFRLVTRRLVQQGNRVSFERSTRELVAHDSESVRRQVEDGLKIESIQEVA